MSRWLLGGAFVAMAAPLSLACTVEDSNNADGAGGGQGATTGAGGGAQAAFDCPAVLDCALKCPSSDAGCPDACLARGTSDGQAKAVAFVGCVAMNACKDATCIKDHCLTELGACVALPPPTGGTPLQGPPPTGSVPASFVGTWKHTTETLADDFTFNADGTAVRKILEVSSFSGCSSSVAFEYAGTVVFTPAEDAFTFYIATATDTSNTCGQSGSMPGETGAFDFTLEAIPALGPGHYWFFNVQGCPVTAEADKRVQCGGEYDL